MGDFLRRLFGPATEPEQLPPVLRAFFDRCEHGTQFLDECLDCPDGCPMIPDPHRGAEGGN